MGENVVTNATIQNTEGPISILSPELENSWSFYLSEIAVRHITNRMINTFYQNSESSWLLMPIQRMIRVAQELESQLTQWSVIFRLGLLPLHHG